MRLLMLVCVLLASCPLPNQVACDDRSCPNQQQCAAGVCIPIPAEGEGEIVAEGEGETAAEGEGEMVGEGEGENVGEGEGEITGEGEGEVVGEGEGEPVCENCAPNEVCDAGLCVQCNDNNHCGPEDRCVNGACVPSECSTTRPCENDNFCNAGECRPGCLTNDNCESECNISFSVPGTCVDCVNDTHCGVDEYCENNACLPGCNEDEDCGTLLCSNHSCICTFHFPCAEGQACSDGTCVPECDATSPCEPENYCDGGTCTPGCFDNSDCGERVCLQLPISAPGVCVNCIDDWDCTQGACVDNSCDD